MRCKIHSVSCGCGNSAEFPADMSRRKFEGFDVTSGNYSKDGTHRYKCAHCKALVRSTIKEQEMVYAKVL